MPSCLNCKQNSQTIIHTSLRIYVGSRTLARRSMSNRYPLKSCLAFRILPRNIQHIWFDFACDHFQSRQQIGAGVGNLAVNPGLMRENHILFWPNRTDCIESDMGLRGPPPGVSRSFRKTVRISTHLSAWSASLLKLQTNIGFDIDESKR